MPCSTCLPQTRAPARSKARDRHQCVGEDSSPPSNASQKRGAPWRCGASRRYSCRRDSSYRPYHRPNRQSARDDGSNPTIARGLSKIPVDQGKFPVETWLAASLEARKQPCGFWLLPQNQRQPVLPAANHHNLCIRTLGQKFRSFNAFPLQQLRADALGYNLLEVAHARSFDPLALRFLLFFLQAETHSQRFLLRLLLRFDRSFERGRQLDITQQNAFHNEATLAEKTGELIKYLLGDHLTFAGVESIRSVRGSRFTNGRAHIGLDQDFHVIRPDFLVHIGSPVRAEVINQGSVEVHDQALARRHASRFLDFLSPDREFVIRLQRVDEVDAFGESFARDPSKQRQN